MELVGQSVLLSRRLVGRVCRGDGDLGLHARKQRHFASELGPHWDHFKACQGWLLPGFDRALSALLDDLQVRGMLDETLVVCLSEMAARRRFNARAGRDHWSERIRPSSPARASGAGRSSGAPIGLADSSPTAPSRRRTCWQRCITCAASPAEATILDHLRRPLSLYGEGMPIRAILA